MDGGALEQRPQPGHERNGQGKRKKHGNVPRHAQRYHDERAEHCELALGEIDDARGIVNDVQPQGHEYVCAPVGQAGKRELNDLR